MNIKTYTKKYFPVTKCSEKIFQVGMNMSTQEKKMCWRIQKFRKILKS